MSDPRVQAMFEYSTHSKISTLIIGQNYYGLPKKLLELTEIYITFSNLTFSETFKNFIKTKHLWTGHLMKLKSTSDCWVENYQPLVFDMVKDK